jgi:hypothetical protein
MESSDNEIYENKIHHNGDGAVGWADVFSWNDKYYVHERPGTTIIRDNYIHHNRIAVFGVHEKSAGEVIVKNNILEKNGGYPIHYGDYDDFDTAAHPEDWKYDGDTVLFMNDEIPNNFSFGTNTLDGEELTGAPEEEKEQEKEHKKLIQSLFTVLFFISLILLVTLSLFYLARKRSKRSDQKNSFFHKISKRKLVIVTILVSFIFILSFIHLVTYDEEPDDKNSDAIEKDTEEKYTFDQEEYNQILDEYCSTHVSQDTIERNKASHFGIIHSDPAYHQELVEAGLVWERTISMMIDMNALETISDDEFAELLHRVDMYIMKAQLSGIWFMEEVFVNQSVENCDVAKERLGKFAERYDTDGVDDMPCLKYPVEYFAIGNEVEVNDFFRGSEEDYFSILKMSYEAIKGANPNAKIVQAGMISAVNNPYWDRLFEMGAAEYCDIANIHEVSGRDSVLKICTFREEIPKKGLGDLPWWITEIQFEHTSETPSLSSEEYAKIMTKYLTYALARGYDKLFIVNFKSPIPGVPDANPPFGDASALINSDGEKTDLFYAVKTAIGMLDQFEAVDVLHEEIFRGHEEDGTWNIKVIEGQYKFLVDDVPIYVLWGSENPPAELTGDVLVTDITGRTEEIDAGSIQLTDSPIFVEVRCH